MFSFFSIIILFPSEFLHFAFSCSFISNLFVFVVIVHFSSFAFTFNCMFVVSVVCVPLPKIFTVSILCFIFSAVSLNFFSR